MALFQNLVCYMYAGGELERHTEYNEAGSDNLSLTSLENTVMIAYGPLPVSHQTWLQKRLLAAKDQQ